VSCGTKNRFSGRTPRSTSHVHRVLRSCSQVFASTRKGESRRYDVGTFFVQRCQVRLSECEGAGFGSCWSCVLPSVLHGRARFCRGTTIQRQDVWRSTYQDKKPSPSPSTLTRNLAPPIEFSFARETVRSAAALWTRFASGWVTFAGWAKPATEDPAARPQTHQTGRARIGNVPAPRWR